ncbi:hypothetical protein HOY80DRAFT_992768 [Tuber brumale]|nr:hypothetical protein HOY80DRAFT_992768 [Tuber brumale]
MGDVERELSGIRSTTHRPTRTIYSNSCKEGDAGILPHVSRPNADDWPTLMFGFGVSESLARLREDAVWWLNQNNHAVHAVVVTHIQCQERIIDLEVWRMLPIQPHRPVTRSNPLREPQCDNQLHIDCSTVPATILGTLPFFIISFEDLVLRPKADNETDFFLTGQDIEQVSLVFRHSI